MSKNFQGIKKYILLLLFVLPLLIVSSCSRIGEKSSSLKTVYLVMLIASAVLFVIYCFAIRKKDLWMLLLFAAIMIINGGYLFLANAKTLSSALWANRVAYFGSALLPLSMLMMLLRVTGLKYKKWLPSLLSIVSIFVFLVAATPGILDIYYAEVSLGSVNGVSILNKVYGPWHSLYLYYLVVYFGAMLLLAGYALIAHGAAKGIFSVALAIVVFINIGIWLLEQLVHIDIELLSISYTISELFLICLYIIMGDKTEERPAAPLPEAESAEVSPDVTEPAISSPALPPTEEYKDFCFGFRKLTPTERIIYGYYVEGRTTKEIMQELHITENTLKFHNKNLYTKLGISSRKQLVNIAHALEMENIHPTAES